MRKLYALLLLLFSFSARATHMSGGEIYWEHLGGNQYLITLTIYRDCAGIQLDNDYDLDITSPCGTMTLNVSTNGGTELSQLCDQQLPNSTCNGGNLPGIEEYVYTGVVTLPPCDSWTISWTEIYRNNAIVNLQAPGTLEMYIEAVLDNSQGPVSDSPQFTNTAIPYICLGYPISYSYGAYDPEGDSLSYELIGARVGGAQPIAYVPPYTGIQPITGINLDPATGLVTFTLNIAGNWVVVVQVNVYDDQGNLIGTIMRDMQFIAYPCTNEPPDPTTGTVSGMSGGAVQTSPYAIEVCESGDFCFDMVIADPNPANILEATSNIANNLPGATFSYTGTNPITCHVCWNATPNTAGFYPFIVNVNDGACPIVAFQTYVYSIHVIEGLFIDVNTTNETCVGMGNGTATVSVLAGMGPYQYNWSTLGATGPSITAGAGTYPVEVIDGNGCVSAPTSAVINTSQPPTANAGPDLQVCYGDWPIHLPGAITNAVSSNWSGGTGGWSGVSPNMWYTPSAAEIASGGVNLTLTAMSGSGCPNATDVVHIDLSNAFLNASVSSTNATCNGGNNGTASFSPPSTQLTYLWSPGGQTGSTATGLSAGNYSVLVTDQYGCTATLSATVGQPQAVSIANMQVTNESCLGIGNGTATVTATGGTPPYQYTWSNGGTSATIIAGSGTYTVSVTDANGCAPANATATINAAAQPNLANAGADQVACMGYYPITLNGSVVNATGGYWSGGSGGFTGSGLNAGYTPSAAEIAAGSVNLTLTTTGNTGCPPDNDVVHITLANAFLNAQVGSTNALCYASSTGTATFSPSSAQFTYLWTPTGQTASTATGLPAGNYTVLVTDQLGCDTTMSVTVGSPAALAISNVQVTSEPCAGSGNGGITVTVTGGTPPYQYNWSNGATSATIVAGSGTYTITVTDANGCAPATATATITPAAQPNVAQAGPDQVACMGNYPVALNGIVVNATGGTWSGGSGSFTGTGLNVGYTPSANEIVMGGVNLTLTTMGNTNCPPAMDVMHITLANSFLNASVTGTSALCAGGSSGTATFSPSLPSLTYLWSPSGQTTPTAINLPSGNHSVHVTDALGCDTLMSVFIAQPPPLALVSMQSLNPTCAGVANGSATITVLGGTPGYTYQWSANAGGQITPMAVNLGPGTYIATVTDANGCSVQSSVTLTAPPPILLTAQVPDTVCVNAPVQLMAQASGGDGNLTITWAGIGQGTSLVYSFPASQNVVVNVTDQAGCSGPTLTFPVYVLDLTTASLVTYGDTTVCEGGVANVGALVNGYSGLLSYSWPELGVVGPGPHAVPVINSQILHVNVTNTCAQTLQATVELVLEIPPVITLPPVLGVGCAPLTVQFPDNLTTQNVTWLWNFGDGNTSTAPAPTHTYEAGSYTVSLIVTTPAGCSASALNTSLVTAYPQPNAAFTASTYSTDMDAPTVAFTNNSTGSINGYSWAFGDGDTSATDDPTHTYTDVGDYTVQLTVTDVNGCTDQATAVIEILPVYEVEIPNAFTPNINGGGGGGYDPNDLSNDVFYPFVRFVKEFQMRIWNRWGELVFESNDILRGWDGYYKGQLSPQDVYVYHCQIRFVDDREAERRGDITLFR